MGKAIRDNHDRLRPADADDRAVGQAAVWARAEAVGGLQEDFQVIEQVGNGGVVGIDGGDLTVHFNGDRLLGEDEEATPNQKKSQDNRQQNQPG